MKSKIQNAALILLLVVFAGYLLWSGISDFTNKQGVYTVNLDECYEIFEVEHSINGLIPTGTDYYYLGFDEQGSCCIINASKGWYAENFDEATGETQGTESVTVTALAKDISDYEIEDEIREMLSELEDLTYIVGNDRNLVIGYKFYAIARLGMLPLAAVLLIAGKIFLGNGQNFGKAVKTVYGILIIAYLFALLKVL